MPLRSLAFAALISLLLLGCSSEEPDADAVAFCTTGRDNVDLIVNPPLSNEEEVAQSIEFYRLMGELAPLDIAEEWNTLLAAMETANTLTPGDQDSEQLVAQTAYAAEKSAYEVMVWFRDYCKVTLPITTIVPHGTLSATTPPTTTEP